MSGFDSPHALIEEALGSSNPAEAIAPSSSNVQLELSNKPNMRNDQPLVKYLRESLIASGYRIDFDPEYEERYKINLIVTRIKEIHAHVNLGILATLSHDDFELQTQFLEGSRRGVVHKSIYVEIDGRTLETGAVPVTISACMSFLFDRRYSNYKCIGLRVFEDCTFHLFDVEENVKRLHRDNHDEVSDVGQEFVGNIIAYFTDKGFGFIETADEQKYFFHIANVQDEDLRLQLPAYIPGDVLPVFFKYGGSDGKKYPKAVDVLLDESREYEESAEAL